jgi:hypothetical protein
LNRAGGEKWGSETMEGIADIHTVNHGPPRLFSWPRF